MASAADQAALNRALQAGMRPRATGGSRGLIITIPSSGAGKATFRTLINTRGELTSAGTHYYSQLNQPAPDRKFDPDQQPTRGPQGRSERILLRDGTPGTVRTWNHLTNSWKLSKLGLDFYGRKSDRWIVRVPVTAHVQRVNGSYWAKQDWIESTSIPELGEMAFPASMTEPQQRAEVKRRVAAWLATKTEEFEGEALLLEGDYDPKTYDASRSTEYSREETRIVGGVAQVNVAIDRPLNHIKHWVFCDMYDVHGLAPEGFEPAGNCVVHQLELLVRKRGVLLWTRQAIEGHLDGILEKLYPSGGPYYDDESNTTLDWRVVGVTARMVLELCRLHEIPVHILWHDHVVESFTPAVVSGNVTRQALHIRGDHAYFYKDPHTKGWITRHSKAAPKAMALETMKLARRAPETDLSGWLPLPPDREVLAGHFYLVGEAEMLRYRTELHQQRICPKVYLNGPCAQNIKSLIVKRPGKTGDVVVHCVPRDFQMCAAFVERFNKATGKSLKYCGESPGAIMAGAFEELSRPNKRKEMTQELRQRVFDLQRGLCADCGDTLHKFQIDHRVPLCFGGDDEFHNMAAVCPPCHAQKSYGEVMSNVEDGNPLTSRFNRETFELFVQSAKPPQLVANVHPPEPGRVTVQADVIRCRLSQLLENVHDLPVFSALDEIEETRRGELGDYNWIHRTRDLRSPIKMLPYFGPGFYWKAETAWMLDVGIVTWDEIKFTFTASAHFPPSYLATRLQRLDTLWGERRAAEESSVEAKFALNAMLGVWSMTKHVAYHLTTTSDPDDVMAEKVQVTPAPGSEMRDESYVFRDYVTKTKMLSFASLRPVHQICLSQERLVMAKLNYILDRLQIPRRLLSFRNDGASIQPGRHLQALRDALKVTYGGLTKLQRHEKLRRCL